MSEIRATIISDAAGTGPITLTGQSAAKAWVNFNAIGTVAVRNSFNVSSITDNGTGDFSANYSNSFNAADYATSGGAGQTTGDPNRYVGFYVISSPSLSRFVTAYPASSYYDGGYNAINAHGDLA